MCQGTSPNPLPCRVGKPGDKGFLYRLNKGDGFDYTDEPNYSLDDEDIG